MDNQVMGQQGKSGVYFQGSDLKNGIPLDGLTGLNVVTGTNCFWNF